MGASSVTGVGRGAADGSNKGSSHMTLGVGHLIGPRIMLADQATLDASGNASVVFPNLGGVVGDYVVSATDTNVSAANAVAAAVAMDATSTTITLKGTASQTVSYAIIKKGLAI